MMLVRSPLPNSIDIPDQEILCVWIPDDKSWQKPPNIIPKSQHKNTNDALSLSSLNLLTSSQLSIEANNMSETSKPNFVYKRRKTIHPKKPVLPVCQSATTPTLVYKRRNQTDKLKLQKCVELRGVNESCSSSKSNMEIGSDLLKHRMVDDVGECSSSGVVVVEGLKNKNTLETNSCVEFLRQHGVLKERISTKKPKGSSKNIGCLRSCKVCDKSTTTLKMLICDLCEEVFHLSCCNPVVKRVPVGDWFCQFCSRKKLKKMKDIDSGKSTVDYLGPFAAMLRDVDPFESDVRIGEDFQVEVPDWCGPLTDGLDEHSEPTVMSPLECASYQEWDSSKLSRLGTIGNWLQCRGEVADGVCGKWRRAPLFEVQTDKWECFSSVLWDPTHADCAVPQELDTDQVLKQLKYIEMLRPRLSAKRWKVGVNNKGVNREGQTEDLKNTHKS